jgi:hypothetical protein
MGTWQNTRLGSQGFASLTPPHANFAASLAVVIPAQAGIQFVTFGPKGCQFKGCGALRRKVRAGFPLSRE